MILREFVAKSLLLLILAFCVDIFLHFLLLTGLNRYYGINQEPKILVNGSSMAMSGFNSSDLELITGDKIANYSHEGVTVQDRFAMISYFYHKNPVGVKSVVYEVNPLIFSDTKTAEKVYTIFYPFLDNKMIDSIVRHRASPIEYFVNKYVRTKRYESRLIPNIIKGYLGIYNNVKTNKIDPASLTHLERIKGTLKAEMLDANVALFEKTMELIMTHRSKVFLVMMPMYNRKLDTFNKRSYDELCTYFVNYASGHLDIEFINLNTDSLINNPDYFSDPLHFNYTGQRQITRLIGSRLKDSSVVSDY